MIGISRAGSMRSPVIVVGRLAFKFARDARGRASNLYEAKLYRTVNATRRALLCPVVCTENLIRVDDVMESHKLAE
jgi:hypothetical protein